MSDQMTAAPVWTPPAALLERSAMRRYMRWLHEHKQLSFDDYHALWQWSVDHVPAFWESIWQYFEIEAHTPYNAVLSHPAMPGARWFTGATLNYAEHMFRNATADRPALVFRSEREPMQAIAWSDLRNQTASVAHALREMGVRSGDRVVAYLPNIPQAVAALLACASLGAIWSSCSPDFGSPSVIDRFQQIAPKVLIAVDGYQYGGKTFDRRATVAELQAALPTLEHSILVPYLDSHATTDGLANAVLWPDLLRSDLPLHFEAVPFDHPLWVLYSSGTTGLPKPIVQGQGGVLLEHLKAVGLHTEIGSDDRFFWFTTTGWMMWNYLIGGLLLGATIALYDGSPGYPHMGALWQFVQDARMTCFGTSASYIAACMQAGIVPREQYDLSALRSIGSTGSPLPPEGFQWIYDNVDPAIWLQSVSGGTDLCTAFVGGCALLPVYRGELQCRCLGAAVHAFDSHGQPVIEVVGELVITQPMPSMPLYFWNDAGMARYRDSYFGMYDGVWRHGDWIKITERGTAIIYGRSDSTINRGGVRMGTSEFYRVIDAIPDVTDSLVIDLEGLGGASWMALFVVLRPDAVLDQPLIDQIKARLRGALSPRHVPDAIYAIPAVPRTLNGKKLEVPIKKLFMGVPIDQAANPDSMSNPETIQYFVQLAEQYQLTTKVANDRK